ncbi:hypothetical protein C5E43_11550 [Nocardia cyriacigeorgica]|nr:hypothetical protein C5B73_11610 [Nocardia cyriacigeorgica]PPJ11545.1 hypothetical protein C5E43_11550 [Nocardia cyriacigeorgica]
MLGWELRTALRLPGGLWRKRPAAMPMCAGLRWVRAAARCLTAGLVWMRRIGLLPRFFAVAVLRHGPS